MRIKEVLISIKPKWCKKIASGKKTIEVRKFAPKEVPFKAYIYCTKDKPYLYRIDDDNNFELMNTLRPKTYEYVKDYNKQNGKVIGEFICDKVYSIKNRGFCFSVVTEGESITDEIARQSCLDYDDMVNYLGNKDGYGLHITDLKIYDKPKELSEFKTGFNGCEERDTYHYKFHCYGERPLTRPPQSWQYAEEL